MASPTPDPVLADARALVRREAQGVLGVADQMDATFTTAVDMLLACDGMVFVTGGGTNAAVARRMAHLLSVSGTPALFIHAMDALHGTMGAVRGRDVVIVISRGGESDEVNEFTARVRAGGTRVIALTATPSSTLAQGADLVVTLANDDGVDPGGVIAMGSTLATAVWGDALAYVLMRIKQHGWDRVLYTHPAGAVGQRHDLPAALAPLDRAPATPNGEHVGATRDDQAPGAGGDHDDASGSDGG